MGIDNSENTMNRIINHTKRGEYDFLLHVGDIAYADDHFIYFQQTWNTWFTHMTDALDKIVSMYTPGNHEYCSLDPLLFYATKDFVVYNQKFQMPQNAPNKNSSMFYSFDYGPAHFVAYSTETSFPGAPFPLISGEDYGDQMEWLKTDLQNVDRTKTPWVIAFGHRPIYCSKHGYSYDSHPENGCPVCTSKTLQTVFEDIFYEKQS